MKKLTFQYGLVLGVMIAFTFSTVVTAEDKIIPFHSVNGLIPGLSSYKDAEKELGAPKEGLINSCVHSERCSWVGHPDEFGGHPLVQESLSVAHSPSDGPLTAPRHTCSMFLPQVADAPGRDSPSRN